MHCMQTSPRVAHSKPPGLTLNCVEPKRVISNIENNIPMLTGMIAIDADYFLNQSAVNNS